MAQQEAATTTGGETSALPETSSRRRRQTVFYEPALPAEKETFRVPKGSGARLRDIPAISASLAKIRAEEPLLQDIHRILFKRTGIKTKRKRDIGDFSGFDFSEDDTEVEIEKLKERIGNSRGLRKLVDFFGIPVKTGKERMMDAIVEFLVKPEDLSEEREASPPPPKRETPKKKVTKRVAVSRKRKSEETKSKAETTAKSPSKRRTKKRASKQQEKSEELPEEPAHADVADSTPVEEKQSSEEEDPETK